MSASVRRHQIEDSVGTMPATQGEGLVPAALHVVDAGDVRPRGVTRHGLRNALKVELDLVIALLVLVVTLPVLILVALLVFVESPGPIFYRAWRIGHRGRPLGVLKFRKMHRNARGGPLTLADDARFTRMGAFLAKTRIDELPQLWNVARGQMSLVGPRPEDPQFVALHPVEYEQILRVRPGITGWSQLVFADESHMLARTDPVGHYIEAILPQKVAIDRRYALHRRLRDDLKIMILTPVVVFLRLEVTFDANTGKLRVQRPPREVTPRPVLAPAAAMQGGGGAVIALPVMGLAGVDDGFDTEIETAHERAVSAHGPPG
jgi:lipopolysaccharide/colanic/teichoic acid biosynthesis glycosyltransferase